MNELTLENFDSIISELPSQTKILYFEILAHNLTIAGRAVWSNEKFTSEQKVNGMKWLNEIMHRVLNKLIDERRNICSFSENDFINIVIQHVKQCPEIQGDIAWALKDSYKTINKNRYQKVEAGAG